MNKQLLLILILFFSSISISAQSIFINEVNYLSEETQGDCRKGVAIVGPSGESLDSYSLEFYNGTGTLHNSIALSGTLNNTSSYAEIWYDIAQFNSDNSETNLGGAIALIKNEDTTDLELIQFISFGTIDLQSYIITAVEGNATGMNSAWVGKQTDPCYTLQMVGTGTMLEDFVMETDIASPDRINENQFFSNSFAIELLAFEAENEQTGIALKWQVAQYRDIQSFVIERSSDGFSFNDIYNKTLDGSSISTHFSYLDRTPSNKNMNYYRLIIRETSGSISKSNIISVQKNDTSSSLSFYPNPVVEQLHIVFDEPTIEAGILQILDVSGRLIVEENIAKDLQMKQINIDFLENGLYVLSLTINGKSNTQLFYKK